MGENLLMSARLGKLLTFSMVLLSIVSSVAAQQGKRSNFLDSGPGSAGASLGGAVIAKGMDASAAYFNPATLVNQYSGALMEYAQPNIDATRSWLGITAGGSIYSIGLLWKNETLPISSNRNAFLFSNSISDKAIPLFPRGISLGFTLGYVQENIVGYSASSFLASAGAAYSRTVNSSEIGLGLVIRNLYFSGLQFRPEGEKEVWPAEPELGGYFSRWGLKFLMSAKGQNQNNLQYGFGLAYQPFSFMEFRAGLNGHPRFGIGIEVKKFRLDYAMNMGEIKNASSMSLSYFWGKPEKEKDYTNPLIELSLRYESLPQYLLAELRNTIQNGDIPELRDVFRLLVVDPNNEDGWNLYTSLTGLKRLKVKMPFRKKVKRQYFEFATAYANKNPGAIELAEKFIGKYPRASVSNLIRIILEKDR